MHTHTYIQLKPDLIDPSEQKKTKTKIYKYDIQYVICYMFYRAYNAKKEDESSTFKYIDLIRLY